MKEKSYPSIAVSIKTLNILKYIGSKIEPVKPEAVAAQFDMNFSTVMTHIATLERENFISKDGEGYVPAMEAARIYAMRKSIIRKKQEALDTEKAALGM